MKNLFDVRVDLLKYECINAVYKLTSMKDSIADLYTTNNHCFNFLFSFSLHHSRTAARHVGRCYRRRGAESLKCMKERQYCQYIEYKYQKLSSILNHQL